MPALEIILVLKPLGEFIFDFQIRSNVNIGCIIMMGVGLLYMVLPKDRLVGWCCVDKYYQEASQYSDIKLDLKNDYSTFYPVNKYEKQKHLYMQKTSFVFHTQTLKGAMSNEQVVNGEITNEHLNTPNNM